MTKTLITSTKQLAAIFSYLPRTNKFKRCIDKWLNGLKPELYIESAEPFHSYKSKTGKSFRFKLSNARGEGRLICRTYTANEILDESAIAQDPTSYRNIQPSDCKSGRYINGKDEKDGIDWKPCVSADRQRVDSTSWGQLALNLGKLLAQEATVFTQDCGKCGGSGFIPAFAHVYEGVCFECMGLGKHLVLDSSELNKLLNRK